MNCKNINKGYLCLLMILISCATNAGTLQSIDPATDALPLKLKDLTGVWHSLENYRGKVVLINFWGSWCHACVEEMPDLQELNDQLKNYDFKILAVNVNQSKTAVLRFLNAMSLHLPVLLDSSGHISKSWQVKHYPTSYILDKNLKMKYFAEGLVNWNDPKIKNKIERLIHCRALLQ